MLIKTSAGDRIIVFGHWANMKKGVPGWCNIDNNAIRQSRDVAMF